MIREKISELISWIIVQVVCTYLVWKLKKELSSFETGGRCL